MIERVTKIRLLKEEQETSINIDPLSEEATLYTNIPQMVRHTFATLSLQNGTDVKTVSASLGHATTAFTMDQYGHVTEAMRNDGAKRMEALIDAL